MPPAPAEFVFPCLLGCALALSGWTLEIRIGNDQARLCLRHADTPARMHCSDEWENAIAGALQRSQVVRIVAGPFRARSRLDR